ncbi:MAG: hypothetical protein EBS05_23535 [Proteobacteria bacterium]|nr:hypothetical protein [Pseudomonadota bacterium]
MNPGLAISIALAAGWLTQSAGALEVLRASGPQHVFAGGSRDVELLLKNSDADVVRFGLRLQLLQLTSSLAAPVGAARTGPALTVLSGQTVVVNVPVDFPGVRASTRFAVRWLDAAGRLLGVTDIWAHPDNLLDALKRMAGSQPLGLADEAGLLRPVLAAHGIPVTELNSPGSWNDFQGRLAFLVSSAEPKDDAPQRETAMLARAKAGVAVIWLQVNPATTLPRLPLAERLPLGRGSIVRVPTSAVAGLDQSPVAQLTLVRLAELALAPPAALLAVAP